jgi:hypothetical protein
VSEEESHLAGDTCETSSTHFATQQILDEDPLTQTRTHDAKNQMNPKANGNAKEEKTLPELADAKSIGRTSYVSSREPT